ncbi:MAG: hypothetical protein ACREGC_04030, partial [Minisyncoccia bacterium]
VQVNGSDVNNTVNILNTTATTSVGSTSWTLAAGLPDQLTLAIGIADATHACLVDSNAQSFGGTKTFTNGLTITAGQNLTVNSDVFTDLTGTGLTVSGGALQTTLGTSVDLTSEVTGTLPVLNGGTGQTSLQAAINSLSGLTTTGDLLYYDGTNTTRLARGSNGDCLTRSAVTILWGSCGSGGANTQLSNLSGTVAVNLDLNPGTDNTLDLGSLANSWHTLYAETSVLTPKVDRASSGGLSIGTTNATSIAIGNGSTTSITLTAGNFDVGSSGIVTLAGGNSPTSPDITTLLGGSLAIQPSSSTGSSGTGAALSLLAGNQTGNVCTSPNCTGGTVTLQGGDANGSGGTTHI